MFATIVHGHENILRFLLDKGASPTNKIYGYKPVELAYSKGKANLQKLLLSRGAQEVNENVRLQIDIVRATRNADPDAILAALRAGADINSSDPSGDTPLTALLGFPILSRDQNLTKANLILLTQLITEWKANPAKGSDGKDATYPIILWVSMNSFNEEDFQLSATVLEQLILWGADVRASNNYKETALHIAAKMGNVPACQVLLKAGANVAATDFQNQTPISVAKNARTRALLRAY